MQRPHVEAQLSWPLQAKHKHEGHDHADDKHNHAHDHAHGSKEVGHDAHHGHDHAHADGEKCAKEDCDHKDHDHKGHDHSHDHAHAHKVSKSYVVLGHIRESTEQTCCSVWVLLGPRLLRLTLHAWTVYANHGHVASTQCLGAGPARDNRSAALRHPYLCVLTQTALPSPEVLFPWGLP